MRLALVCLGGAFGSAARYLLSGWVAVALGPTFPYGTLAVNVIGSFLLGALMQVSLSSTSFPVELRIALGTGALGGFTTYSTFSYETFVALREGALALAALNVAVTVLGCLLACWLGSTAARAAVGG